MQNVKQIEASIIIASHRPEYVPACLDALTRHAAAKTLAEIIVVADYPVDRWATTYPEVRWIYMADESISSKRNRGIASAGGAVVGFVDDDCIPRAGWIDNAIKFLRDNADYAGVAGQTIVERAEAAYPIREFKRLELPGWRTNNIFYRKADLLDVGGFDERFTVQREDVDVAFSILARGRSIGFSSDIQVLHRLRDHEPWDLLKNCRNRRFDPLLYKKHASAYRTRIGSPFPPTIALMLLQQLIAVGLWCVGKMPIACGVATVSVVYALGLSIRRNGFALKHFGQSIRDSASYCVAPYALIAALLYGSVKFRSFLLF